MWAFGNRSWNCLASRQCVVQFRSSSSPAAPRMKAPLHTLSSVASVSWSALTSFSG